MGRRALRSLRSMPRCEAGGILSADLYKVHINPALDRLKTSGAGYMIGDIFCGASACADDLTVGCSELEEGQVMLDEAEDFSSLERFDYQPVKSVAVTVYPSNTRTNDTCIKPDFKLNGKNLSKVNSATHFGNKRSTSLAKTGEENIQQNIS